MMRAIASSQTCSQPVRSKMRRESKTRRGDRLRKALSEISPQWAKRSSRRWLRFANSAVTDSELMREHECRSISSIERQFRANEVTEISVALFTLFSLSWTPWSAHMQQRIICSTYALELSAMLRHGDERLISDLCTIRNVQPLKSGAARSNGQKCMVGQRAQISDI
jgi:hypothetical protein